jgi:pimeloyl-ACP methyl ester carboxylesterase
MSTFSHAGIRFSYVDQGTGAPFVFQHGLGGDMTQPAGIAPASLRLVCLECRGHGATQPLGPEDDLSFATFADDVVALLDHLGLDTVMAGGISMGAGVALRIAAEHPARTHGLVLVRPSWFDAPSPAHLHLFATIADLLQQTGADRGKELVQQTPEFAAIASQSSPAAASVLSQFDRPFARERAAVLARLAADYPLAGGLSWNTVTTPTLVVATQADPQHPFSTAENIARSLPRAVLREVTPKAVDSALHAAEVRQLIDDFAAGLDAPAVSLS